MKKIRLLTVFLTVLLCVSSVFGCAKNNESDGNKYSDYYEGINLDSDIGYVVKDDKTDYKILIPEKDCPEAILQAATELSDVVFQSAGVRIPLVKDNTFSENQKYFSVGRTVLLAKANLKTDYSSLNNDGFVLKTVDGNIIVDAGNNRGFMYGVYEYLEKIVGVKYLSHDETFIPKNTEIKLYEMDVKSVPAFEMRTFLDYQVMTFEPDEPFIAHSRTVQNMTKVSEKYGGNSDNILYGRGIGTHNAHFYIPAEKYADSSVGYDGEHLDGYDIHPEFYTKMSGMDPDWDRAGEVGPTINWLNGITEDGKLDETMDISAAKVVIEEMKQDILDNPTIKYILFEQEDTPETIFDKQALEKYGASGVIIRFCNVVATELQKWANEELDGREINIVTFAYRQTRFAPVKKDAKGKYVPYDSTVVPVDNLFIRLAYTSCQYFSYDDERQPNEVKEMTKSWSSICKNFFFWGYDAYYVDFLTYNPSFGQIYGTVQLMRDIGVRYMLMQSASQAKNDWQSQMKAYVWTKLLWNPDQDVSALKDEYIDGYYGKAAPCVRALMNLLDAHYATVMENPTAPSLYGPYSKIGVAKNLTTTLLDRAISIVEKGEADIENDTEIDEEEKRILLLRLARVKATPMWMKLENFSTLYPMNDNREKLALAQELFKVVQYGGLTMLTEGDGISGILSTYYGVQ